MDKHVFCMTADELGEQADRQSFETARENANKSLERAHIMLDNFLENGGVVIGDSLTESRKKVAWVAVIMAKQIEKDVSDFVDTYC